MSSEKLRPVVMDVLPVFERVKTALALKNDAALARALDASPKKLAVWKLRNFVPYDHLITLCRHYKLSLDRILGGEERPSYSLKEAGVSETKSEYGPGFVFVPQMRGEISAGGGLVPDNAVEMKIAFREEWIKRRGDPKNMSMIRVSGDSMEPTLQSGDLALVDHGRNYVDPQGGIYAIAIDHTIMIKRLQVLHPSKTIRVISDNGRYEPIETDLDRLRINGKVIWFGREIER